MLFFNSNLRHSCHKYTLANKLIFNSHLFIVQFKFYNKMIMKAYFVGDFTKKIISLHQDLNPLPSAFSVLKFFIALCPACTFNKFLR